MRSTSASGRQPSPAPISHSSAMKPNPTSHEMLQRLLINHFYGKGEWKWIEGTTLANQDPELVEAFEAAGYVYGEIK